MREQEQWIAPDRLRRCLGSSPATGASSNPSSDSAAPDANPSGLQPFPSVEFSVAMAL